MENPEPTETEKELSHGERQDEEDDMRGTSDPRREGLPEPPDQDD